MTLEEARLIAEVNGFVFVKFSKGCGGCGTGDNMVLEHKDYPHLMIQLIKNKNLIGRFVVKNKSTGKPYFTGALNNINTLIHEKDFSVFE